MRVTGANASLQFYCEDGAVTFVYSPSYSIVSGDVGKAHVFTGVHDGSNLRLYVDRSEVGSGTSITGADGRSAATVIGSRPSVYGASGWTICGVACGVGVPSLATVQSHHDAVKAALAMTAIASITDRVWTADATGDQFDESEASEDAVKSGSALTVVTDSSPTWGF